MFWIQYKGHISNVIYSFIRVVKLETNIGFELGEYHTPFPLHSNNSHCDTNLSRVAPVIFPSLATDILKVTVTGVASFRTYRTPVIRPRDVHFSHPFDIPYLSSFHTLSHSSQGIGSEA